MSWPTWTANVAVVGWTLVLRFHECFSVPSKQKPMIAEQPWTLDVMSFGLGCLDRRSNQDGQYNSKREAGASGGRVGPCPRSERALPHPLRPRCIGHRLIAPVLVEFPLLIVLIQRFEECDQRCDIAGCKCDPLKLHGAIAQPACSDLT